MSSLYTRLKITLGKANADSSALPALLSDDEITITEDSDITLLATDTNPTTGIIFYPGGRCDPHAYAPVLRPLAAAGYLIVVPHMPLRLAVLDANRAGKIMGAYPGIKNWAVGGHSMGGAIAAAYVYKHPATVGGLFFIASYPAKMHALPDIHIPVTMLYGTHDFITRKSEFEASHERLPKHTDFVAIQGGDHYQFGSFCNVDITATISRDEQQLQTVSAMQNFLNKLA